MTLSRRGLLGGLVALVAAPAIVRVENLMVLPAPAKVWVPQPQLWLLDEPTSEIIYGGGRNNLLTINMITRETVNLWTNSNAFLRKLESQYDNEFSMESGGIGSSLRIRFPTDFVMPPPRSSFSEWAREREAKILLAGLPEGQGATNSSE